MKEGDFVKLKKKYYSVLAGYYWFSDDGFYQKLKNMINPEKLYCVDMIWYYSQYKEERILINHDGRGGRKNFPKKWFKVVKQ